MGDPYKVMMAYLSEGGIPTQQTSQLPAKDPAGVVLPVLPTRPTAPTAPTLPKPEAKRPSQGKPLIKAKDVPAELNEAELKALKEELESVKALSYEDLAAARKQAFNDVQAVKYQASKELE